MFSERSAKDFNFLSKIFFFFFYIKGRYLWFSIVKMAEVSSV